MTASFPKGIAWINGDFVDISRASISILDWGFLRSDATYDVVHVWKNRFFLLDRHVNRFFESAEKLRMPVALSRKKIKNILAECVNKSKLENAYVEMIQTRGVSPTFDRDPRKSIPRFISFAVPFSWILKPDQIEIGLDIAVTSIRRIPPNSVDSTIKNYHWLDLIGGMFEAYDRKHQTGVLVDGDENILEGPGFNIFSLDNAGLHTPNKGVLKGVTRSVVLDIAKEIKVPINLNSISLKKILSSSEVFATSTAGGIMPITKINGFVVGRGGCGKITRKIYENYWKKHEERGWSCSVKSLIKKKNINF